MNDIPPPKYDDVVCGDGGDPIEEKNESIIETQQEYIKVLENQIKELQLENTKLVENKNFLCKQHKEDEKKISDLEHNLQKYKQQHKEDEKKIRRSRNNDGLITTTLKTPFNILGSVRKGLF